jgi:ACS family tartrate transporter-like MFS transporter
MPGTKAERRNQIVPMRWVRGSPGSIVACTPFPNREPGVVAWQGGCPAPSRILRRPNRAGAGVIPMPLDLETRVVRKLRRRILPFAALLYFVSFLDRVNIGFAAFSMNKAIGLSPAQFGFGGGIFFVGYILFQVPSNMILHRVGARSWIARVVVAWGLVSAGSAFVVGPYSFYAMRFLLGVAEAGFFPGILLYLTRWFPARHRAVAIAVFMAAAPLSTAIGSPISGALMELPRIAGLSDWQWLFILEALPAIILGFVVMMVLCDRPEEAPWLEPNEREWLTAKLREELAPSPVRSGNLAVAWSALRDPRVIGLAVIYSGTSAGLYAVGLWSPLIIRQYGFSPMAVGWLNTVPSVVAVVGMMAWARSSDRRLERSWHVAIPCMLACAGLVWAGLAQAAIPAIVALTIVNFGSNASKGPLWAVPSLFLSGAGAAAGIAWINSLGNIGGFIGPILIGWMKTRWGSYAGGLDAVGAMLALSAVLMLLMSRQTQRRGSEAAAEKTGVVH